MTPWLLTELGVDLDRHRDLVPGGAERSGRFFPRKPARPMGQKQHVGIGQRMLAIAPGNLLDDHGFTAAAIDAQTHSDFGYVAPSLRYRPHARSEERRVGQKCKFWQ